MKGLDRWKQWARLLRLEAYTLYLACKDARVPWYAKAFAALVAGYAFSPIDLIPDPIPVLGYLDDLLLVPLGVVVARRMIPKSVLDDCRERANELIQQGQTPVNRTAAVIIVALWVLAVASLIRFMVRRSST